MRPHGTVRLLRGGRTESVHRFAWRLTDRERVLDGGGYDVAVFLRSAAKPYQALPAVRAGVLERFGLDDRDLAIACASHGGTTRHVARVAQILVACGLSEDALGCGPLVPREPAAAALLRGPPRRIHHNCSGKHALGLALCVAEGWPLEGYLAEDHPLQRAMRAAVGEAMGVEDLPGAVDGCGMRTYHVPLERLAMAFARLTVGALGAAGTRVAEAMRVHPGLVAFGGALDTELMAAGTGVVAKIGAEAVIGVGTSDGRGLALKVLDGAGRALDPATVLAARALLGLALDTPALTGLAAPRVLNSRGEEVGRLQAQL